jgi:hypothetical protein
MKHIGKWGGSRKGDKTRPLYRSDPGEEAREETQEKRLLHSLREAG